MNDTFDKYYGKTDGSCWLWTGGLYGSGYGAYRGQLAHRVMYERTFGPIPEGMFICHHCDNPQCVNPEHLFLGTCKDNNRDASKKGRLKRTEDWKARLSVAKQGHAPTHFSPHTEETKAKIRATKERKKLLNVPVCEVL